MYLFCSIFFPLWICGLCTWRPTICAFYDTVNARACVCAVQLIWIAANFYLINVYINFQSDLRNQQLICLTFRLPFFCIQKGKYEFVRLLNYLPSTVAWFVDFDLVVCLCTAFIDGGIFWQLILMAMLDLYTVSIFNFVQWVWARKIGGNRALVLVIAIELRAVCSQLTLN